MQNLSERLDNLEKKLHLLLRKLDSLAIENRDLKEENNQLKKELKEANNKTSTVYPDKKTLAISDDDMLHRIKNELGNYIEEVDHCISLLES